MKQGREKGSSLVKNTILGITGLGCLIASAFCIYQHYTRVKLDKDEQKIVEEYRLLKNDWLYGNETEYLSDLALQGILLGPSEERNDPYTFYTSNREEQGLSRDGKGFGFSSHSYDGGLYVSEVHVDSSAEEAGLAVGDVLYSISSPFSYQFNERSYSEVSTYLKTLSSEETYTFSGVHANGKAFEVQRKKGTYSTRLVDLLAAPSSSNGNTLILKINTRLGSPTSALKAFLEEYKKDTKHLVLDFRGNGGGYLDQAAERASLFVKKGTLIYERKDKNGKTIASVSQEKSPSYSFENYSIIRDGNTASASESFILARRAGTNAKVYGLKSYGKGIAQNIRQFSDGSVVRYTSAYVYGPERANETRYDEGKDDDGIRCIHKKGILPDVAYPLDYSFLASDWDISKTKGISDYGQDMFLRALNLLYPDVPDNYSKTYHFDDAIESYFSLVKDKYSLTDAFDDDGTRNRKLNQKWVKDCYDLYLDYSQKLTRRVYD